MRHIHYAHFITYLNGDRVDFEVYKVGGKWEMRIPKPQDLPFNILIYNPPLTLSNNDEYHTFNTYEEAMIFIRDYA